jgi:hypothetical protein
VYERKLELIIASLTVASVGIALILDVFPLSESQSSQMYVVTGPKQDIAIKLINRMK